MEGQQPGVAPRSPCALSRRFLQPCAAAPARRDEVISISALHTAIVVNSGRKILASLKTSYKSLH